VTVIVLFYSTACDVLLMIQSSLGAKEDRFHEVVVTTTKAAKDPQFFFYPPKEEWWAVAMEKKPDTYGPPGS